MWLPSFHRFQSRWESVLFLFLPFYQSECFWFWKKFTYLVFSEPVFRLRAELINIEIFSRCYAIEPSTSPSFIQWSFYWSISRHIPLWCCCLILALFITVRFHSHLLSRYLPRLCSHHLVEHREQSVTLQYIRNRKHKHSFIMLTLTSLPPLNRPLAFFSTGSGELGSVSRYCVCKTYHSILNPGEIRTALDHTI